MHESIIAAVQEASVQYSAVQYNVEVERQTIGSSSMKWCVLK